MKNIVYQPMGKTIENLLDTFFNSHLGHFVGSDSLASQPLVNMLETADRFQLEVAAPGLHKEDFQLKIETGLLTLEAKPAQKTEVEKVEKPLRKEFNFASFKRSFKLPENVDTERISAKYDAGVLYISLPKVVEKTPAVKQVDIH